MILIPSECRFMLYPLPYGLWYVEINHFLFSTDCKQPQSYYSNILHSFTMQLGFVLLALIWEYDFPPFMVLIIAILNDGKFSSF